MTDHTILLQKTKKSSPMKDTEKDFGVVCLSVSIPEPETKEPEKRDWLDEDGEDVYIPPMTMEKAVSMNVEVGYKGSLDGWESELDRFMDYLTGHDGSGVELLVYLPYLRTGRKCRFVKMSKLEWSVSGNEIIVTFSIETRIDSPRTRVVKNSSMEGLTYLSEKNR